MTSRRMTGGAGTDKKVYNVGVSIYKFDDNFMTLYRKEIESYFKTLNTDEVEYKVTIQDGKATWPNRPTRSTLHRAGL